MAGSDGSVCASPPGRGRRGLRRWRKRFRGSFHFFRGREFPLHETAILQKRGVYAVDRSLSGGTGAILWKFSVSGKFQLVLARLIEGAGGSACRSEADACRISGARIRMSGTSLFRNRRRCDTRCGCQTSRSRFHTGGAGISRLQLQHRGLVLPAALRRLRHDRTGDGLPGAGGQFHRSRRSEGRRSPGRWSGSTLPVSA